MPVTEIEQAAKSDGHSMRTVQRAKKRLDVKSKREGFGRGSVYQWYFATEDERPM